MDLGRLFDELEAAAGKVDIQVRIERLRPGPTEGGEPRGGICVLHGSRVILIDDRGSMTDRIATLAASLAPIDLEHIYLPPIVRATIGAYRKGTSPEAGGASRARPLAKARRRPRDD